MADNQKIGVCGLACFKCSQFTREKCPGCRPNEFCPLPKCAEEKGVDLCFECGEFPCDVCYEKGALVKPLLDFFKKEREK